jgi:Tat protein secretion system quality control protein TatD with DNase activity
VADEWQRERFRYISGSAPDRLASGHPHRNASDDTLAILKEESEREGQGASVCIRLGCSHCQKANGGWAALDLVFTFLFSSILTFKPLQTCARWPTVPLDRMISTDSPYQPMPHRGKTNNRRMFRL